MLDTKKRKEGDISKFKGGKGFSWGPLSWTSTTSICYFNINQQERQTSKYLNSQVYLRAHDIHWPREKVEDKFQSI